MKTIAFVVALTGLLFGVAPSVVQGAEERIEGVVISTVLTACDMKPGTCEGSLVLDTKGKDGQVTVKVPKGTQIKKGNDHVFLPGLKGSQVAIEYVNGKGERVAKSIEVKLAKP
jgi:ribulose 1,5-bisphosphate synthetase/thiazole synthase